MSWAGGGFRQVAGKLGPRDQAAKPPCLFVWRCVVWGCARRPQFVCARVRAAPGVCGWWGARGDQPPRGTRTHPPANGAGRTGPPRRTGSGGRRRATRRKEQGGEEAGREGEGPGEAGRTQTGPNGPGERRQPEETDGRKRTGGRGRARKAGPDQPAHHNTRTTHQTTRERNEREATTTTHHPGRRPSKRNGNARPREPPKTAEGNAGVKGGTREAGRKP